jgi:hypothetical protein
MFLVSPAALEVNLGLPEADYDSFPYHHYSKPSLVRLQLVRIEI